MGKCCGPSTCFTCKEEPSSSDACMCGCGYLNGMCAIWVAQFFTLIGSLFSVASASDCSFATIDRYVLDFQQGVQIESKGVGLFFFEKLDGYCYYYNEVGDEYTENQLQIYWTLLGDTWTVAWILSCVCASLAWYFFLYSVSFCCSSQIKCCRYANGLLLALVLTSCQAGVFAIYGSEFCEIHSCQFSRGSGFAIGAILCYIVAGVGFFLSSDYPGEAFVPPPSEPETLVMEDPAVQTTWKEDQIQEDPGP